MAMLSAPPVIAAQQNAGSLSARLDSVATEALKSSRAPGLAVVVMRGNDTMLARGYGVANTERHTPMAPTTIFPVGSITKSFTAAGILSLAAAGRLQLSDSVGALLRDYEGPARRVAISALLAHTGGVPNFVELPEFRSRASALSGPADVVRLFAPLPLAFSPGERWAYSNSGYVLLGKVIEVLTGMDWDDYITTHIARAAGLRATRVCSPAAPPDAAGYDLENGVLTPTAEINPAIPYSAGSLCSSALELVRWMNALANGSVISRDSYHAMTTPVQLLNGAAASYGYGMEVTGFEGHQRFGHGGAIAGYDSYAARYPSDSLVIAVLANRAGANAEGIEKQLARVALGIRSTEVKELSLGAAEGVRYVGQYRAGGGVMRVSVRGLRLHVEGPVDSDLKRVGENDFVLADEPDVRLRFVVTGDRAESLSWTARGRTMSLPRLP